MTIEPTEQIDTLNRAVCENVTTLIFRSGWKQKDLAHAAHWNAGTLSRKLKGLSEWTTGEIETLTRVFAVSAAELLGDLPSFDEWVARPERFELPTFCLVAEHPRARHLWAVS